MIRTRSVALFVAVFAADKAQGRVITAPVRASAPLVSAATTDTTASGIFAVSSATRCSGHYSVAWGVQSAVECQEKCTDDEGCASFSWENGGDKGCFFSPAGVVCTGGARGWTTGHKDAKCGQADEDAALTVKCPYGMVISEIPFASYGTPTGGCHNYTVGSCHEENTKEIVEDLCLGESECTLSATSRVFGEPCGIVDKELRVEAKCQAGPSFYEDAYFNAWSSQNWGATANEAQTRKSEWMSFASAVPEYPAGKYDGRGIIVVAGGRYLEPAVVQIEMLRNSGCKLRIQVWHVGDQEMTAAHRKILAPYDVETRNFEDFVGADMLVPIRANVGMRLFQLKPLALLHSDLENIMLLDSDNVPIRDPTYLFDTVEFKETGTIFWPDYWQTSPENPIWSVIGVEPSSDWEQESGQLVLRKQAAWKAINLAVHMNSEFYMKMLNGDKDTFRFSWIATGVPYVMVDSQPTPVGTLKELHSMDSGFCSHTMLQHDLDGKPLFVHHNQIKDTPLKIGENFQYQKTCKSSLFSRATPVSGLHLDSGATISCTDLQVPGSADVNEGCEVTETPLKDFEEKYFAALAKIPANAFTAKERAAPSLLDLGRKAKMHTKHMSGQQKAQIVLSNRLRRDGNTTCTTSQFELVKPTIQLDRVCEVLSVCDAKHLEVVPATKTSDRICATKKEEADKTYTVKVGEKTATHPYSGYGSKQGFMIGAGRNAVDFKESPDIFVSRLSTYSFEMEELDGAFMLTLDAIGGPTASPYEEGVSGSLATTKGSLSFTPGPHTPSMLYYHSDSKTHMGWRIHVSDPTFKLVHGRHADAAKPLRFGTAHQLQARLFSDHEKDTADNYKVLSEACQARCAVSAACQGLYIFRAAGQATCYGLQDVSGPSQPAMVESQSILKVVM